jgi:hypothetical protein
MRAGRPTAAGLVTVETVTRLQNNMKLMITSSQPKTQPEREAEGRELAISV